MSPLIEEIYVTERVAKVVLRRARAHPSVIAEVFALLAHKDINVLLIAQSNASGGRADIGFVVFESQAPLVKEMEDELIEAVGASDLVVDNGVALISIYGSTEMSRTPGIAARVFDALASVNAKPEMMTASVDTISFIVREQRAMDAYLALKDAFRVDDYI